MNKKNRKDTAINTNSNSTSFKFSVVTSHTLPLNQRISLEGGELKVTTCPAFEGSVETIDCRGITHLTRIIENLGCYQAIIPGCMHRDGEWVEHGSICWDNPDREYYEAMDDNALDFFGIIPRTPSIFCLHIPNIADTAIAVREHLCESIPRLRGIGFAMVPSPTSHIRHRSTGMLLTGANGYRFYFLAKVSAETMKYGTGFTLRALFGDINQNGHSGWGRKLPLQSINVKFLSPGHPIFEAKPFLDERLVQERPPIEIHAGGILDTENFCA